MAVARAGLAGLTRRLLPTRPVGPAQAGTGEGEREGAWAGGLLGWRARAKSKGRKEKGNLFLFNFSKAVQNTISTQIEIRLQIKQYKMLCNSMNAHSLLLTLYLVLFLIKLLFPKFKFPQNAELIIFSYFQKYEKFRVLHVPAS